MCRRNIRNAILILAVISVLLPGPDLSNAYARPCAGEIEVRSGEGDHSVEAPGIIVIQEVSEGMEEPEDSILVICQELFEKDFDMFFRKKGNFNRPSDMLCTKPNVSST